MKRRRASEDVGPDISGPQVPDDGECGYRAPRSDVARRAGSRPGRPVRARHMKRRRAPERRRGRLYPAVQAPNERELRLPRAVGNPPGRLPAEGALGRLGRARLEGVAATGRAAVDARPDDVLQLRVGLRPARLRRPRDARGAQVRGQPGAPRLAWAQLRQGPGHAEPDQGSRPDPPPASPSRRSRRRKLGARLLGRGARRHRRAHPPGDRRRAAERGHVPRRQARRGRVHGAGAGRLGRRRSQLPHEHLLELRPGRLPLLDGARPPEPRPRERGRDPARLGPPRVGALLQPPRPAHHRRQGSGRQADRARHAALEHGDARGLVGLAVARIGGRDPARDRGPPHPQRRLRPRVRAALVELAGVPDLRAARCRADLRELRGRARGALRRVHVRARRARVGRPGGNPARDRGRGRHRRHAALDPHVALGDGGEPRRLAGVALALPAQRAARRRRHRGRHVPQRLEQVRPPAALHPAASGDVERAHMAGRVPARDERALLPAAALPQGGARLARRVLHARLQPGLDEPRRLLVDRDADRRGADRPARRVDADLERDRLPRRLRAAGRARLRAPRSALLRAVRRPVDRLPPARAARGPRTAGAAGGGHPGGESGRGLGGERALDRPLLADRSRRLARHSALVRVRGAAGREAHRRRVLPRHLRALGARAAGARRGGGSDPARVHAPLRSLRDRPRRRPAPRRAGARRGARRRPRRRCRACVHASPEAGLPERRAVADAGARRRRSPRRSGSRWTAASCEAFRLRAAGSSSTRARSPNGAGPRPRCRRTCAAMSTRKSSRPGSSSSSRRSACPSRSTRARPTRSGSTRSRTRTRCGSTCPMPSVSASRPATSSASRPRSATSCSRRG